MSLSSFYTPKWTQQLLLKALVSPVKTKFPLSPTTIIHNHGNMAKVNIFSDTNASTHTRYCVIIDLDDTILRRSSFWDSLKLYMPVIPSTATGVVMKDVRETVDMLLSNGVVVVAVTARWSLAARNTKLWMDAHGFETIPTYFSKWPHPFDNSRIAYKAGVITHLQRQGLHPIIGVGDRPSDLLTYVQCHLTAVMIASSHKLETELLTTIEALSTNDKNGDRKIILLKDYVIESKQDEIDDNIKNNTSELFRKNGDHWNFINNSNHTVWSRIQYVLRNISNVL